MASFQPDRIFKGPACKRSHILKSWISAATYKFQGDTGQPARATFFPQALWGCLPSLPGQRTRGGLLLPRISPLQKSLEWRLPGGAGGGRTLPAAHGL